jgi:hypothetical protein
MLKPLIWVSCSSDFQNEVRYVLDVIFNHYFSIDYEVDFSIDESCDFRIGVSGQLNYVTLPNVFFKTVKSSWLKIESLPVFGSNSVIVSGKNSSTLFKNEIPIIFGHENSFSFNLDEKEAVLQLDIFGSVFYQLTLYEEYVLNHRDKHERFDFRASIFYKNNLHLRPLVNEYLELFWQVLIGRFPNLERRSREYKLHLSHDVDVPLSINLGLKTFLRNLGGDLISRNSLYLALKRIFAFFARKVEYDPNNNFNFIMDVSDSCGVKSVFNFIAVDGKGNIDGNYDVSEPFFIELLRRIDSRNHIIGFHPGYFTFSDPGKFSSEKQQLDAACELAGVQQVVSSGRQHYLRWANPNSWQIWADANLKFDSSVGYSGIIGFRTGCCFAYPVFNLESSTKLSLIELPLLFMDVSAFDRTQSIKSLELELLSLYQVVKHFSGDLTFLYHNNYLLTKQDKGDYKRLIASIAK